MPPSSDHITLRALMASELPLGLLDHIDRVVVTASGLARRYGCDEARTLLMAQAHDLVRAWSPAEWLAEADRRSFDVLPIERTAPVLLHGPLGSLLLAERGWVTDTGVLQAVCYHTTGHPAYSAEAWAMFIADKVEPRKLARRPALQAVVDAAGISLEAGALAYLDLMRVDSWREGWVEHPLATRSREWLRTQVG